MNVSFEFKTLSEEKNEEGFHKLKKVNYNWNVPKQIKKETSIYFFANEYGISTRQADDIINEWNITDKVINHYENNYSEDFKNYIKKNYEIAAYNNYKKEILK